MSTHDMSKRTQSMKTERKGELANDNHSTTENGKRHTSSHNRACNADEHECSKIELNKAVNKKIGAHFTSH